MKCAILLFTLCFILFAVGIRAQPNQNKIAPDDYLEANQLARTFWANFLKTKDIGPLLIEFAINDFYRCLDGQSFAFLRKEQIRPSRKPLLKRYYVAETNFMFLFFLWSNSTSKESDDVDPFLALPGDVKRTVTKRTWDAIDKNDSDFDPDRPLSDKKANEYFDRVLRAFEQAVPLLRKHVIKNGAGRNSRFLNNLKSIEEYNEHAFHPELTNGERPCGVPTQAGPEIIVDVPFFQLDLARIDGKLRIVAFPFHVD